MGGVVGKECWRSLEVRDLVDAEGEHISIEVALL